jgi:hypothetical protein
LKTDRIRSHFSKWDIIILTVLLLFGIVITTWIYLPAGSSGNTDTLFLEIRQNGELKKTLPLSTDTEETISSDGQSNTFLIKNGAVSMETANCGDHTCIRTGAIKTSGESIVCLPHRLVLQIISSSENSTDGSETKPDVIVH